MVKKQQQQRTLRPQENLLHLCGAAGPVGLTMGEPEHWIHSCGLRTSVVSGVCPPVLAGQGSGASSYFGEFCSPLLEFRGEVSQCLVML